MDDEIIMLSPYQCVIPGVDQYLALKLRTRAEESLAEAERENGGAIDCHPALVAAICMDCAYEHTIEARLN